MKLIFAFKFRLSISSFGFRFRVLISSFDFEFQYRFRVSISISSFDFKFDFPVSISNFNNEFRFRVSVSSFKIKSPFQVLISSFDFEFQNQKRHTISVTVLVFLCADTENSWNFASRLLLRNNLSANVGKIPLLTPLRPLTGHQKARMLKIDQNSWWPYTQFSISNRMSLFSRPPEVTRGHWRSKIKIQDRLNDLPNGRKFHRESNPTTIGTTRGHQGSPKVKHRTFSLVPYIRIKLYRRVSTTRANWPEGPVQQDQTGPEGQYIRTKLALRASTSWPNCP